MLLHITNDGIPRKKATRHFRIPLFGSKTASHLVKNLVLPFPISSSIKLQVHAKNRSLNGGIKAIASEQAEGFLESDNEVKYSPCFTSLTSDPIPH